MTARRPEGRASEPVPISGLPSALAELEEILSRLRGHEPAFFLDYDGTLAPIVERPEMANLPDEARAVMRRLVGCSTVTVISGRDLEDVRRRVGIDGIHYAGSHGLDIASPAGASLEHDAAGELADYPPLLDRAEEELREALDGIPGAEVERKRFAIAVHYRRVDPDRRAAVGAAVDRVASGNPELRTSGGKEIFELRPGLDWDKGRAVLWLLERLGGDGERVPVCLGDDVTDEDAFRAIAGRGVPIVVGEGDRRTHARYALRSPSAVVRFLEAIAGDPAVAEGDREGSGSPEGGGAES